MIIVVIESVRETDWLVFGGTIIAIIENKPEIFNSCGQSCLLAFSSAIVAAIEKYETSESFC